MSRGIRRQLGGMAANVACAAAALGAPWPVDAALIAPLGDDADGVWVERMLRARGVDTGWLDRGQPRTSQCLILVEDGGERAIVSEPSRLDYGQLTRRLQLPGAAGALYVDGFHAPGVVAELTRARAAGWLTAADLDELPPDWLSPARLPELLAALDLLLLNRRCLQALFGPAAPQAAAARLAALAAPSRTDCLLTLGAAGALLLGSDGAGPRPIAAPQVAVVDSTGAGDVCAGVFLSCRLHGADVVEAAQLACAAASLSTTAAGALGCLPGAAAVVALRRKDLQLQL